MPRPTAKRCSTSPGPAAPAQSAATDQRSWENAYPSERNLGLLTGQCRAGGVALFFTGLSDQFPQTGLKRRTTVGECQATTGQLQIGRASCRERVCQYGESSVVGGS